MQICPRCGTVIQEGVPECTWCKTPLTPGNPTDQQREGASQWPVPRISPRSWLSLFLLSAGCLAIAMAVFGAFGVYKGTRDRQFENRRAAVVHYQKGLEYLRADRKELAAAEFREAVHLVPDFAAARDALKVVEDLEGDIRSIPTLTPAPDLLAGLFAEGKSLYEAGRWREAAAKFEELIGAAPNYRSSEVQDMLFNAHMQAGLAAVNANQWKEALRHFDQALAVRPNDPEAMRQRAYAEIYQDGARAWGKEWDLVILSFGRLYKMDPQYHDVATRLREAHVQYGNVFYSKRIWCQAEEQYREAIKLGTTEAQTNLKQRVNDAARRCAIEKQRAAMPRPTPTAQAGQSPSPGQGANTPSPAGFSFVVSGTPAADFSRGCSGHYIFGEVRNAAGEGLPGVQIRAVDQWGNVFTNTSKDPPDQGKYDIPINALATTYQVAVVGEGNTQLSAAVTVTDTGRFVNGSEGCWHRVDWVKK